MRMVGIGIIALVLWLSGSLYAHTLRMQMEREDGFLLFLSYLRAHIQNSSVPLYRLYGGFSHPALERCGFLNRLRQEDRCAGLLSTLEREKERLHLDETVWQYLAGFASEVGNCPNAEAGAVCCDKYKALLSDRIRETREQNRSRAALSRKMGLLAAAFCIIILY